MKELVADESLSEEARDSARKALEVLVSSQLLDIEQTAAVKKRASALKELESEAQTKVRVAEVEIQEVEAEAQTKRKMAEAKKMLRVAEHFELSQLAEGLSNDVPEWLSEEMAEWLGRHRLQSCATDIARIAGAYVHDRLLVLHIISQTRVVLCMAGRWSRATFST